MVEEEKFFAWLDGELEPREAAEVERQVASDPELSRQAAEHREMIAGLRTAFDPILKAPVPERLQSAVRRQPAEVVHLSAWREKLAKPFSSPVQQWAAMAATLALGLVVGTTVNSGTAGSPIELRGSQMYAAGAIDRALDTQLASAGAAGNVRIGITFRNASGQICRSFESSASAGLACRDGEDWRVRGLFAAPEGSATEYRMAAGADPRLMELAESEMIGEPFDPERERAAREGGWR